MGKLVVCDHPLIHHKLSLIRDEKTGTKDFRQTVSEIGMLMAYEVTRDFPTIEVETKTPVGLCKTRIINKEVVIVPILRAGLGMVDGIHALIPNAIVLTRDGKRKKTDFLSSLQRAIDTLLKNSKITLILTGSNVSFLETEINDSKAPLYQRNTFSLLLKKFEWDEALDFLLDINDNFEKAKILALTNTFPYYLSLINPKKSFEANLDDLFYKETATFTDDPSKIITSNIVTSGLYASIIKNISNGNDTLSKLCEVLKTDTSKMTKYLKELIADNVIKKRANFNSNRNAKYEICDPMLSYYYRFIRENSELIKTGYGILIKKEQTNQIKAFIERAFEYECLTYLEYLNKKGQLNTLYYDFGNCNIDNTA